MSDNTESDDIEYGESWVETDDVTNISTTPVEVIEKEVPNIITIGGNTYSGIVNGLFSADVASANFDGQIGKIVYSLSAGNVTSGNLIYLNDDNTPTAEASVTIDSPAYFVESTSTSGTTKTINFIKEGSLYSINLNVYQTVVLFKEDWDGKSVGTTGWIITSGGNAIFSNIYARGTIEASSGKIGTEDDFWYIGNSTYESPSHGTIQSFPLSQDTPTTISGGTAYGIELDASGYIDIYKQYQYSPAKFYTITLSADKGLEFFNANSQVGTVIPPSGNIIFRAVEGTALSGQALEIQYANSNISSAGDKGALAITTGMAGTTWSRLSFDSNELQSSISTNSGNTWSYSTTKINENGGNVIIGNNASSTEINGKTVFTNTTELDITSGAYSVAIGDTSGIHMRFDGNEIQRMATATTAGQININTNGGDVKIGDPAYSQFIELHGTNININTSTGDGPVYLGWGTAVGNSSSVRSDAIYYSTNTTAANMYISAGRIIYRSTASSERYKRDISSDLSGDLDPFKILDINVVKFKYNNDYITESDLNYDNYVIGFIAEDIATKYPIAVSIDEEGNPENWNDRFLVPAMLKVIQSHEEKIKNLEERLAILEG